MVVDDVVSDHVQVASVLFVGFSNGLLVSFPVKIDDNGSSFGEDGLVV